MKSEETVAQVEALILPVLQAQGVELVEAQFVKAGKRSVLRLFVDKPEGITLDDCAALSGLVGEIIDVHDIIDHTYTLEVSSPGLTRPLKKRADYARFTGRLARVTVRDEAGRVATFRGELKGLANEEVLLQEGTQVRHISLNDILRARLDPDF